MSLEKIRRISNHRYNGLSITRNMQNRKQKHNNRLSNYSMVAYWDVDPNLNFYMAKYKDERQLMQLRDYLNFSVGVKPVPQSESKRNC